jgi:hypothetical protein
MASASPAANEGSGKTHQQQVSEDLAESVDWQAGETVEVRVPEQPSRHGRT